jgi:two-component sensor histidine kinase
VATISLVHEALSQTLDEYVDLDGMLRRALRMTAEVAATGTQVRTELVGSFGSVPARDAAPLALVLTELVTNAVEHGFGDARPVGTVTITAERAGAHLSVRVVDDGLGLETPDIDQAGRESKSGLGVQIVRTLVEHELAGTIAWASAEGDGTEVLLEMRLRD